MRYSSIQRLFQASFNLDRFVSEYRTIIVGKPELEN